MSRKERAKIPELSTMVRKDVFVPLYRSLTESPAYLTLTSIEKSLYIAMQQQAYKNDRRDKKDFEEAYKNDMRYFTMNKYKYRDKYKICKKTESFIKARDELIRRGLIDCVIDGSVSRTKNLYKLSRRWHKYGTDEFQLPVNVMSNTLIKEVRKNP